MMYMIYKIKIIPLLACIFVLTGLHLLAADVDALCAGSHNVVIKKIPCKVNQGVAVNAAYFYAISNTHILKYDKDTCSLIAEWRADRKSDTYKHLH